MFYLRKGIAAAKSVWNGGRIRAITPPDAGHLHINLLPDFRGNGYGSELLAEFFNDAKAHGLQRVYADSYLTRVNPNEHFWRKNGFEVFSIASTDLWRPELPDEKISIVCYVKDL